MLDLIQHTEMDLGAHASLKGRLCPEPLHGRILDCHGGPDKENGGMKRWVLVIGVQGGSFMETWALVR